MAKKKSEEDDCRYLGYLILFGLIISGPLCLLDAFIYTTLGSSIWASIYPEVYNLIFMFIWGSIITLIDVVVLYSVNKKLAYFSFYILGWIPVFLISTLIAFLLYPYPEGGSEPYVDYIPYFDYLANFYRTILPYITIGYFLISFCVLVLTYIIIKKGLSISIRRRISISHRSHRRIVKKSREELERLFPTEKSQLKSNSTQKYFEITSFEKILREAKRLRENGSDFYKKREYQKAVDSWQSALRKYDLGLTKMISKDQKEQLENNISIITQDIAHCLLEIANQHRKSGEKYLDKYKLHEANTELRNAIRNLTQVKTMCEAHKVNKIEVSHIDENLKLVELNLKKVDIEQIIEQNEKIVKDAETLKKENLTDAIKEISDVCKTYLELKNNYKKDKGLSELIKKVDKKVIEARKIQELYQKDFDKLIGIIPVTSPVSLDIPRAEEVISTNSELVSERKKTIEIKREYDFVSGEIRFRIALKNLRESTITNIKINFDVPSSLKWVVHEPRYPKKGDTIEIPKLGAQEKTSIAIYLTPISCLEAQINATITYFDAYNNPHALTMNPKTVAITCPIFFTIQTANLARVKNLYQKFAFRHTKVYPIIDNSKAYLLFEIFIKVLNEFDIKMVLQDFNQDNNEGEAWFYGETKVKKNRLVIHIFKGEDSNVLQLEVAGNTQEQVTSFLAEINSRIKDGVLKENLFNKDLIYNDIKTSILSYVCPYCGDEILDKTVQKFIEGESMQCRYCNITISAKDLNILDR